MYTALYEKLTMIEDNTDEMYDFFIERTNGHIQRVQDAVQKIANEYPEFEPLIAQAEDHDASKFEEPEKTPYIELTWSKKTGKGEADKEGWKAITQATLHHIKNNSHHPEYHLRDKAKANLSSTNRDESIECVDATAMPDIDVAEMVADWQAMSEELETNTSREWFEKVRGVRWSFSREQEQLIDKLLKVFEGDDD